MKTLEEDVYKCDVCGRNFYIWWVDASEWFKSGFDLEHVCKKCFELKAPNPYYFSVDEFIDFQRAYILELFYNMDHPPTLENWIGLERGEMLVKLGLEKVWDKNYD